MGARIAPILATVIPALLTWGAGRSEGAAPPAGGGIDISSSAYSYRADRKAEENPPEAWILLVQYAGLPFDRPIDIGAAPIKAALCGLLWEEVRPARRVELSWPSGAERRPPAGEVTIAYFDGTDGSAHTWWNPRTVKLAGNPEVSADGSTYAYAIPVDTWGVVAIVTGGREAKDFAVPAIRAFMPGAWKRMDIEIEWGFEAARSGLRYDGTVEAYDGVFSAVAPLDGDAGTTMTGPVAWRSERTGDGRRGLRLGLGYVGTSVWRDVWPYAAQAHDVARTIVTVRTASGTFSFLAADLEHGPILAPEYGFFVRASGTSPASRPSGGAVDGQLPREPLSTRVDGLPGVPLVRGWARVDFPWLGANPSGESRTAGSLSIPARCVATHPAPDRAAAIGWVSPVEARVDVRAKVAMGDSKGGSGVDWWILFEKGPAFDVPASGSVGTGGSRSIPAGAEADRLRGVTVRRGDRISLIIGPRYGSHACTTTIIDLAIDEAGGGGRTWSLTRDVADDIHAGNPHPDKSGDAGVWRFDSLSMEFAPPPADRRPFPMASTAASARDFLREMAAKDRKGIRLRTRAHAEQTWKGAVEAMRGADLPPHPVPPILPAMEVEVPCERLTAQWKLGPWHILARSVKGEDGRWRFNDHPFGILASETYLILRALDLQGMHREAADGLDQWLSLPLEHRVVPGSDGFHDLSIPDRPLGHFSDGKGCLTLARGIPGAGGHMDGVHCMGPGAIMFALTEHARLTGDREWLKAAAPRMKANVDWMLRQRKLLSSIIPGGDRLWSKGLQPAHVVTPDSFCMHMQFYESEAYYWLAVRSLADLLAEIDPPEGARLAAEAESYRRDLVAAIDRSIAFTPVTAVRDGTYRSFVPFAPYVRGFAAGAWGWRRCQGHVGAIYWDTVQSADPLVDPSGLLSPSDPRVQGHLDVLEDRLLLENSKIRERTPDFDPERDWFSRASWQYQCGLERHANIHLAGDDVPNYLRTMLNQAAVDIVPGEYTFREHTTTGPLDKIFEESAFLERFRALLVMEDGGRLWLARATPRAWLEPGKRIAVRNAPTHFGVLDYEIRADAAGGTISATIRMPSRRAPEMVLLRLRHPASAPIREAKVDGRDWKDFDAVEEVIRLKGLEGLVTVQVRY